MAECPQCKSEIGNATYCGCGWGKRGRNHEVPIERRCACGYEGCPHDAMCKIQTKTGWLNVCDDHYRIYHHAKAEAYCRERGLLTTEQKRAWLREEMRKLSDKMRPDYLKNSREPGDDEEAA